MKYSAYNKKNITVTIPLAGWPHNISSLKPLMAIRSYRLVVSLISDQRHYTFLYRYAKHNWEGRIKEQTNKHGLGSAPSARGGSLWHFYAALRVFAGYRGRLLGRNYHKASGNADSSLDCPVRSLLLPSADCSLHPSFVNWLSLSSLGPSFPPPLPVSCSGPLCGFRAKTDKEILWVAPTQTETNATHHVT